MKIQFSRASEKIRSHFFSRFFEIETLVNDWVVQIFYHPNGGGLTSNLNIITPQRCSQVGSWKGAKNVNKYVPQPSCSWSILPPVIFEDGLRYSENGQIQSETRSDQTRPEIDTHGRSAEGAKADVREHTPDHPPLLCDPIFSNLSNLQILLLDQVLHKFCGAIPTS